MCGIAGIFLVPWRCSPTALDALPAMLDTLRHRGPDGAGLWSDRVAGIGLGHRRLAIVDLHDTGRQPMHGMAGNLVTSFNGEIYNFRELRADLAARGFTFRGSGDTEVMLAAFECFGIEASLRRFEGMFAIALWDGASRELHLMRDRMGKKPLYIALSRGALLFASELRALRAFPGFEARIDSAAVAALLRYGWIPDHMCIWQGVFKLPPGARLTVSARDLTANRTEYLRSRVKPWWSLQESARAVLAPPPRTEGDLVAELHGLLRTAVTQRMVADVPLGALLSGGIDSTTVVALMQAESATPVRTFTIGFAEAGYDEADFACRVARRLGTEHMTLRISPAEAQSVIPDMPQIWDEPFADESQIPSFLLARLARAYVTVALSGDGGDECFGGYRRHIAAARLETILRLPRPLRIAGGMALRLIHGSCSSGRVRRALPMSSRLRRRLVGGDLEKLALMLSAADEGVLHQELLSVTRHPAVMCGKPVSDRIEAPGADLPGRLMYRDLLRYLPGDVLVKVDRGSMAVALEVRCPLLDHRVVEFALRLPGHMKVRGHTSKWLLRQILRQYVPDELIERPKAGFDVPIGEWLAGPLRSWAEDVLSTGRRENDGVLNQTRVARIWREHVGQRRDHGRELWAILMYEAWRMAQNPAPVVVPEVAITGAA